MIYHNSITDQYYLCMEMHAVENGVKYTMIELLGHNNLDAVVTTSDGIKVFLYKEIGISIYLDISSNRRVCRHYTNRFPALELHLNTLDWQQK